MNGMGRDQDREVRLKENSMKLFNLQSKWHLAGWSVVLGSVIFYAVDRITLKQGLPPSFAGIPGNIYYFGGWPFHYRYAVGPFVSANPEIASPAYLYNLFFWILTVFIILSLIRYFKKRN